MSNYLLISLFSHFLILEKIILNHIYNMKDHNKNVWVGTEDLNRDPEFLKLAKEEFAEEKSVAELTADVAETGMTANRRDFLKYLGFSLGAATVAAGCDIPVKKAIPYVTKPDSIVPGVATYYASSYVQGGDYCPVLVKTREGRPIKVEGNPSSSITGGGTNARAQASVLSLYDTNRIQGPKMDGKATTWADLDKAVASNLSSARNIRIVTNTIISPMTRSSIATFVEKYPNTSVVTYDPISSSAMLEANAQCFNNGAIPNYRFDKANVIVSFGADFLGTWISPIEYAAAYAKNRKIKDATKATMSRHIQVESHMSLTGSNADNRILIKPSEQGAAIATLYNEVAALIGKSGVSAPKVNAKAAANLKKVAKELVAAKGSSLVVSGSNNVGEQILVNAINADLANYGSTLSFSGASMQRQGSDAAIKKLADEVKAGAVDAIIVMGDANPVFDTPFAADFAAGMAKVKTKVYCGQTENETGALCNYVAPVNHYLESWGDAEPKMGKFSLIQPTISPLFDTRQVEMSLLNWSGNAIGGDQPAMDYLKSTWQSNQFAGSGFLGFQSFWDKVLHDGIYEVAHEAYVSEFAVSPSAAAAKINKPQQGEEIAFFETVNMGGGQFANNPWLQELPDPITRCVWGNYLSIPVSWDGGNTIEAYKGMNSTELRGEANKVDVSVKGNAQTITAIKQFGLAADSFSLAMGYGRAVAGPAGIQVGTNVYPWLSLDANGNVQYYAKAESIEKSASFEKELACVQYHHTMGVKDTDPATGDEINVDEKTIMTVGEGFQGGLVDRTILRQANLKDVPKFVDALHHEREHHQHLNDQTLYPYEEFKENIYSQGHHWGMHVDLNACTGCAACTVACMSENNVPVVGKHEVWRHHEMTWLRIDRYFYGDFENPSVVYQPLMCQHCDNAPCENVCPVSATNHSNEGLNQMAYNRCIGTRYCANNCPFKVRRFNWMDYTSADLWPANEVSLNHHRDGGDEDAYYMTDNLTRMVLNPDVTVRARGVMEKCSFCVQRLQEGKLTAKKEGRRLVDSDVKTACQTACPTGAITFGDQNNKGGDLDTKLKSPLNYILLEETDVRSAVTYSAKIVNKDEAMV